MVSSEQRNSVRPASLEHHQPGEGLEAVVAPVHEVPHEDVVCVRGRAALSEQLLQVIELTMDVATHRHGAGHGLDVALLEQEVAHQLTQLLQLILRKIFAVLKEADVSLDTLHNF